jgi:uncharacterized membrane protein
MRARLEIAAIFIAVGLGALTVTLPYDPGALVPHPPYGNWIIGRVFALFSLAALGMILVLGLEDEFAETNDTDDSTDRPMNWFAIGLAFLISALGSVTFIAASALTDYLDRFFKT